MYIRGFFFKPQTTQPPKGGSPAAPPRDRRPKTSKNPTDLPYASIDISPVGEPEHPLVRVLYDTIFSDCPINDRPTLTFPPDESAVLVMAHLEGHPLGFGLAELLAPV